MLNNTGTVNWCGGVSDIAMDFPHPWLEGYIWKFVVFFCLYKPRVFTNVSDWLQWTGQAPLLWEFVSLEWLRLQVIFVDDLRSSIINKASFTDQFFFYSIYIEKLFLSQWLPRWPPCLTSRYQRMAIDRNNVKGYRNSHTNILLKQK